MLLPLHILLLLKKKKKIKKVGVFRILQHINSFDALGPNGAHFSGSVETESLRAPPKKDLRLASLTRSLHMDAPDGMSFKSAAGSVRISSLQDVTIKSMSGKV